MHNPFPSIWADKMAALPDATALTVRIERNTEPDRELGCFFCRHAAPVEWLMYWKTHRESCSSGLCEACRARTNPHPAPPPSPSDENAGEGASDEELFRRWKETYDATEPASLWQQEIAASRALYDLGKQHQASADAATIAGLRADTEAIKRALIDAVKLARDAGANAQVDKVIDRMNRELDGRPEPGGGE